MLTGEKLRLLRISRQIKQTDLARKLGISQQRYSILEKSNTISKHIEAKILLALNCQPDDIDRLVVLFSFQ